LTRQDSKKLPLKRRDRGLPGRSSPRSAHLRLYRLPCPAGPDGKPTPHNFAETFKNKLAFAQKDVYNNGGTQFGLCMTGEVFP